MPPGACKARLRSDGPVKSKIDFEAASLLRLLFRGESFVMRVNHRGRSAGRSQFHVGLDAQVLRVLIFPGKTGCPTWIRTMTKASKGPCATITPSDNNNSLLIALAANNPSPDLCLGAHFHHPM